jgi:hypothetical protein
MGPMCVEKPEVLGSKRNLQIIILLVDFTFDDFNYAFVGTCSKLEIALNDVLLRHPSGLLE